MSLEAMTDGELRARCAMANWVVGKLAGEWRDEDEGGKALAEYRRQFRVLDAERKRRKRERSAQGPDQAVALKTAQLGIRKL